MEEIDNLNQDLYLVEKELKLMLLPKDKSDEGSAYLEIRAGAGGDEAAIFASELLRLYLRLCERKKWNFEIISNKPSEPNGTKEAVLQVDGLNVYKSLKFESECIECKEFLKQNLKAESIHQQLLLLYYQCKMKLKKKKLIKMN